MKTGVQILVYNQEEYLEYFLKSIYPHVDVIQVMYSEKPFTKYNNKSRSEFKKIDSSLDILLSFPDFKRKIYIQNGIWKDEESMRNAALQLLKEKDVQLCLIFDVDEFWPDGMLLHLIEYLIENLRINQVAWCHEKILFKQFDRLIDFPQSKLPIAFIINENSEFINRRIPSGVKIKLPPIFFYWHLGYVLPDQRMYEKIMTFSHADEVPEKWYKEKWINFSTKTTDLCRKGGPHWEKTVPNDPWELPSILYTHPYFPYGPNSTEYENTKIKKFHIWQFLNSMNVFHKDDFFYDFEDIIKLSGEKIKEGIVHSYNPERGLLIYALIKKHFLKNYFEVGTSQGYSLLCALKALTEQNQEYKLTSIDIDITKQQKAKENIKKIYRSIPDNVKLLLGPSNEILKSNQTSNDIVFVDGSHTKEDVLFDGEWAIQNSRKFVLFDDYNHKIWPEVVAACDELMKKYYSYRWYLVVSDRLLYEKERKDDIQVFRESYGILVLEK